MGLPHLELAVEDKSNKFSCCMSMHTHSESPYSDGEGGRVEQHLSVGGKEGDELVQGLLVVHGEQLVSLVQDKHLTLAHVSNALLHQVYDTTRSGYDHMDCRREGERERRREREGERERGEGEREEGGRGEREREGK